MGLLYIRIMNIYLMIGTNGSENKLNSNFTSLLLFLLGSAEI